MEKISRILWFLCIVSLFGLLSTFYKPKSLLLVENTKFKKEEINSQDTLICNIDYESLGEGFLGSKNQSVKKILSHTVEFLGANTRPDYAQSCFYCSFREKTWAFNQNQDYPLSEILPDIPDYTFQIEGDQKKALFKVKDAQSSSFELIVSNLKDEETSFIGNNKLDKYLLVRQKASWSGQDMFLEEYGGNEFAFAQNCQRVDFLSHTTPYSLFLKQGRLFSWKDQMWQGVVEDSKNYPLMRVDRINKQMIYLTIWDSNGRKSEKITLSKSKILPKIQQMHSLKLIGAKSNKKWLIKSGERRFPIEPGDWMIQNQQLWKKLSSPEEIDQYVHNLNNSELLIVKDFAIENGKKILIGELFDGSRTQKADCKVDLSTGKMNYKFN